MTRCNATRDDGRYGSHADRPRKAPNGSRRLTTDLPAFHVCAIAHAALWGRPGAGGELDIAGQRLVLSDGPALEILVTSLPAGGKQLRAACPGCSRGAEILYLDAPGLRCRVCARLVLPSSRTRKADRALPLAVARLARARERIGADPALGAPLPPKLPYWPRRAWELHLARIREAEAAVQRALDAAVARGRTRLETLAETAAKHGGGPEIGDAR